MLAPIDPRIRQYRRAAQSMIAGRFHVRVPLVPRGEVADLGRSLIELGQVLESKFDELRRLVQVTEKINAGLMLDEVLDYIYDSFRPMIPYNRIGLSFLDDAGETVVARWARSDASLICIASGYQAPLNGSSLEKILRTGQPRILNDLPAYLRAHPASDSTRRIVAEGMRSSLTCPLLAMGKPIGFMFFSSMQPDTYAHAHVDLFLQIAGQLSTTIEKSRLYARLVEFNELKNKFLGIAAHDLRNPLNIFQGYLSLLMRGVVGGVTDAQYDLLDRMNRQVGTMTTLLGELLDISAIESGKLALEFQTVDLKTYLKEVHAANQILALGKSIELRLALPATLPPVRLDTNRINQVINNLIGNAIKFSNPGTTITLAARATRRTICISVVDQGLGIPPEELPTLFRDFGKGSTRPTAGESSTGLGLAIVKRIVQAHDGQIKARSTPGRGSTFTFTLPLTAPPTAGAGKSSLT